MRNNALDSRETDSEESLQDLGLVLRLAILI